MDYPSNADVGLINGKFSDQLLDNTKPPSLDPAEWANAVTDEILALQTAGGQAAAEGNKTQVRDAVLSIARDTPVTTGTGTAYAVDIPSYSEADNRSIIVSPHIVNGVDATIKVNSLAVRDIYYLRAIDASLVKVSANVINPNVPVKLTFLTDKYILNNPNENVQIIESLAFTGEIRLGIFGVAPAGWLLLNQNFNLSKAGGIGNLQGDAYKALFFKIWETISGANAPVIGQGSPPVRGGSAQLDWDSGLAIALPQFGGRVLGIEGSTNTFVPRSIGDITGSETHTLSVAELPSHSHQSGWGEASAGPHGDKPGAATNRGSGNSDFDNREYLTSQTGSDQGHNNMQPTVFMQAIIKL